MFRKTLIQLTVLNAVIFIFLMGLLGSSVYFYTRHALYRSVDETLHQAAFRLGQRSHLPPFRQPGLFVVLWNVNGQIIGPNNGNRAGIDFSKLPPGKLNQIESRKVGDNAFRVISTEMNTSEGPVVAEFIAVVTLEKKMLETLFMIILAGWVLGDLLAVAAGYFLARRALRPIQQSWEKQHQFVSDASHELRTPLAIIQTRIEMLLQSPGARVQEKLKDISITLKETRRLGKLVSHLLTLARSDANRIEVKQGPVLVNDIVTQVVDHFKEMADYQGKTLILEMGHNPITILGDGEKIHQLLVILLDNAMKFSGDDGKIAVTCGIKNHDVVLTVADNGIGISRSDMPHIFDRFFQADPSRTNREGTGLGLSIAKWIVEKHRGKITVKSEVNRGSRFTLTFPLYNRM